MLEALSGKTILLTGASGFIGSRVLERLARVPGARVIAPVRRPSFARSGSAVQVITEPLASLSGPIWQRLGIDHVDIVVHLAGYIPKATSQVTTYPAVYEDNIRMFRALLEGLPCIPERVVFSSTVDVYAQATHGMRISESSTLQPRTVYAASKVFLELVLQEHAQASGYSTCVLRLGHVYGPGEEVFLRLIPESIRRLMDGKPALLLGDPDAERDYLYIDDAVEAILRSMVASPVPRMVNIVRGESIRVEDVLKALVAIFGDSARLERRNPELESRSLRFDVSRMQETLGVWPLVPFEEGLRREVDHIRGEGPGE